MGDALKLGIIGGTGVYDLDLLTFEEEELMRTDCGAARVSVGRYGSGTDQYLPVVFLPRHGPGHSTPPHRINYRANIRALKDLGVTCVFATTAVGSLREDIGPGQMVLLDQFVDFTRTRHYTFFDGGAEGVRHTDMTYPYDESLRQILIDVARERELDLRPRGTYFCTEGPRFETAAEIRLFGRLGGDVVGMTNVPEVILANELGLKYAAVSLVTNYGAGLSDTPLTHEEVCEVMEANQRKIGSLITGLIEHLAAHGGETNHER
ncbi:MAG: S-methyl-5'-thioinosine phosphorylase [Bacillota bacterium]